MPMDMGTRLDQTALHLTIDGSDWAYCIIQRIAAAITQTDGNHGDRQARRTHLGLEQEVRPPA